MEQIPTINYYDLKSNNKELSKFLEDSLNDVGFFVIKDHPISSESIDKLFNVTQELFDLPLDFSIAKFQALPKSCFLSTRLCPFPEELMTGLINKG